MSKKNRTISLSTEQSLNMIAMVKRIFDCAEFESPRKGAEEIIAAEIRDIEDSFKKVTFLIYNNDKGNYKFDLEITYAKHKLCMLHTSKSHSNPDGTIVKPPYLHIYTEKYGHKQAIAFYLRNIDNINQCIVEFLAYCGVENIGDLPPLQLELEI